MDDIDDAQCSKLCVSPQTEGSIKTLSIYPYDLSIGRFVNDIQYKSQLHEFRACFHDLLDKIEKVGNDIKNILNFIKLKKS